jgi:anti-sigma regulatory factor (Ser/Thr protein kinase)
MAADRTLPGGAGMGAEGGDPWHVAFFYTGQAERRETLLGLVRASMARGEPAFVALPGDDARLLGGQIDGQHGELTCSGIAGVGRNPARIIPAMRAFVDRHHGQPVLVVVEALWPERSPAEIQEVTRHDALVNLAFSGSPATVVCAYDAARLPPPVIADARRTHPAYLADGGAVPTGEETPWELPPGCDQPLPPPPAGAQQLTYDTDLAPVRRLVERCASRTTIGAGRAADLVLAASEVAANTLGHTKWGGTFWIWHDDTEIVCQADDRGWITDPLAGRVRRDPGSRGHGLYLVNHVCDLVEVRTGAAGTSIRLHMRLPGAGRPGGAAPVV